MTRRVVALTGMHRSGTSLTASWLQSCGLPIDLGGLVGPAVGNPLGHYEDVVLMDLQRREIRRRHPLSRGWKLLRADFLEFSAAGASEAAAILRDRNARFSSWGWKDPRSAAFLPEWLRLEPELRVVVVWRPAVEVVSSLVRRSQGSDSRDMQVGRRNALRTWIAYNELLCKFRQMHPEITFLVPLERLLARDEEAIDQLRSRFGLELNYVPLASKYEPGLLTSASGGELPTGPTTRSLARKATLVESSLRALSDL